jgi:hypothetical protein
MVSRGSGDVGKQIENPDQGGHSMRDAITCN